MEDDGASRSASTKPGVIQQSDGKRRKTDEDLDQDTPGGLTMAPPIRQSNVFKVCPICSGILNPTADILPGYYQTAAFRQWLLDCPSPTPAEPSINL
jgi:hypothetical protein